MIEGLGDYGAREVEIQEGLIDQQLDERFGDPMSMSPCCVFKKCCKKFKKKGKKMCKSCPKR